jgi:type I restriction enzyme M protein
MAQDTIKSHADFISSVADLLRGDYRRSEYGKVILPLTVLRRLDCVLEETKETVLKRATTLTGRVDNPAPVLEHVAGHGFYNTSQLDLHSVLGAPDQVAGSLKEYIAGFSPGAREVLSKFDFDVQIARLDRTNLLYEVLSRFIDIDLHPDVVSNIEMGYIYEELIRRFSELSNETAGEHFTPREVIRLMVNLLFADDDDALTDASIKTLFDPACGTGGMLSIAETYLRKHSPTARLEVFGQELNDEAYAVCRSDMMLKDEDSSYIVCGNSFTHDGHEGEVFDYMLANPPFGVEWKKVAAPVRAEHKTQGFAGRFGAGLPRINDGSLLFLQHMISKMKPPTEGGSRLAIVFNGSPLFNGGAKSGESEIRRWIIENDWLEAVVALPDQLFYNTGIFTALWVLTNRKHPDRRGKVQLVDARDRWVKMRKSLGNKRKAISENDPEQIDEITGLYADFTENERVKILPNESFGYQRITVERPLRLRWEVTPAALAKLAETEQWGELAANARTEITTRLEDLIGFSTIEHDAMADRLGPIHKTVVKQVWRAISIKDPDAPIVTNRKGEPEPDPDLRDHENVPLPPLPVAWEADPTERLADLPYGKAVEDYMDAEVLPHLPDAWVDHEKTRIGYEIPLTRHFYKYIPPRQLAEIDAEIKALEAEIHELLTEVTE